MEFWGDVRRLRNMLSGNQVVGCLLSRTTCSTTPEQIWEPKFFHTGRNWIRAWLGLWLLPLKFVYTVELKEEWDFPEIFKISNLRRRDSDHWTQKNTKWELDPDNCFSCWTPSGEAYEAAAMSTIWPFRPKTLNQLNLDVASWKCVWGKRRIPRFYHFVSVSPSIPRLWLFLRFLSGGSQKEIFGNQSVVKSDSAMGPSPSLKSKNLSQPKQHGGMFLGNMEIKCICLKTSIQSPQN